MEYTEELIRFIQSKDKRYKLLQVPTLDDVVVAFLRKYEVFVQPPKNTNRRDGAIAGAITGMAGADVGGDAFLISGQNKQTKLQEWTSWKQWALDHKEFEAFRKENIEKPKAHNENIFASLEDPNVQIELEPIFKEFEEFKKIQNKNKRFLIIGICILLASGYLGFYVPKVIEIYNEDKIEYENSFK